ncbi:rod shape-determining protein MreC [Fodinibius salsisoli]|uniref:Cell shape-determining protein MreC n=1 Tax=Fodinibius salsisoli TaxID=2820877 RepID=A0ABT3PPG8_9BACT|nr:rod shape-determining protein MreC [Fodinibius salsisoli]MCW9707758.1 rod shape-determining protein MreC [Fodinibius salsisoli]
MQLPFPGIAHLKDHILTAIILVAAIALMMGRHQGGLDNLRKASVTVFSYLEEPLSSIRIYRQALKTNTYLRKQNVLLLDELSRLRAADQENKRLRQLLEFGRESNLSLYPVQVVAKELKETSNFFTIDAGTNQGIEKGMPVVSSEGLAGKVVLTNKNYSQVMPFLNSLFRVSAKLQQSNAYGIVSTNPQTIDELQLDYIPQTVAVDTGETVITSGYSNQFPPDIPIGKVIRAEPQKGKDTQNIFLKPLVNLYQMDAGFVIKFTPDTSIQDLREQYKEVLE